MAAIKNYLRVSGRIASSGQPEERQFKSIAEANYRVVINLAMPDSDHAIPEEGRIVAALEMVYVHIPVPFETPGVDHLRVFLNVMAAFSDRRVWVHCAVNHRASAFLYQYRRLVHGATQEEAAKVMLPSWQPNDVWLKFMALPHEVVAPDAKTGALSQVRSPARQGSSRATPVNPNLLSNSPSPKERGMG